MFTPEQKKYIYENSIKVHDNNIYYEVMAHYYDYFSKAKSSAIKRKIGFILILLVIVYLVCQTFLFQATEVWDLVFRGSAIFVGALIVLKLGLWVLNYIDDMPIIKRVQNKECDMLYFEGDLNDVTKFINYKASNSALYNYYMTVSGNKFEIDRACYKSLLPNKGKKIRIYYFAELLSRQMLVSDASVILIME